MKWFVLHKFIKELQHSHILESGERRAVGMEQRAESMEHGAERGQRAESKEQRAKGREQKDGIPFLISGRENPNLCRFFERKGCYPFCIEYRVESRESGAEGRGQRARSKEQKDGIPFLISGRENPNLCRFFEQKGWHPFSHHWQGKSKPLQVF
jgi:hypothetical protein